MIRTCITLFNVLLCWIKHYLSLYITSVQNIISSSQGAVDQHFKERSIKADDRKNLQQNIYDGVSHE